MMSTERECGCYLKEILMNLAQIVFYNLSPISFILHYNTVVLLYLCLEIYIIMYIIYSIDVLCFKFFFWLNLYESMHNYTIDYKLYHSKKGIFIPMMAGPKQLIAYIFDSLLSNCYLILSHIFFP